MNFEKILGSQSLQDEVISIRRTLHQHPELSEQEHRTMAFIAEKLDEMKIPYETCVADTGIVATLEGGHPGPVAAIRADIDALSIEEETGLPFASQNPGVMHACGHDAHAAVLLGTARVLSQLREELHGTVKFFFQPAEETVGGAARMIEAGCLENPHVDYVLGLHVEPTQKVGQIGIRYGKMMAASDMIDIVIRGKGAHGAHPDEGVDAIMVAASILTAVQTVISRRVSPLESAVCSFGKIRGGSVRNQIADCVELSGIIRTLDPKQRIFVREQVKNLAESVAKAMGAEIDFHVTESYGPLVNDDAVTAAVEKNAVKMLGKEHVILEKLPDLGCEDFSFFALERPSCFFHLGCHSEEIGPYVDLHNSRFTIDERCLMIGVELQVRNVLSLLGCEEG